MYKRIIHNIVEECYYDDAMPEVSVKSNQRLAKAASDLQKGVDQLIKSLVTNIRNYIISTTSSLISAAEFKNRTISDINQLGGVLDGFYGVDSSREIVSDLKNFIDGLDKIMALAMTGADYTTEFETMLTHIDSAAVAISDLNKEYWPESVVKKYLRAYAGSLADQINARIKENWNLDTSFSDYAKRIMHDGPVNMGSQQRSPDFAEVFASGIFKQFPQKF